MKAMAGRRKFEYQRRPLRKFFSWGLFFFDDGKIVVLYS
jgi:hypothetical protein